MPKHRIQFAFKDNKEYKGKINILNLDYPN